MLYINSKNKNIHKIGKKSKFEEIIQKNKAGHLNRMNKKFKSLSANGIIFKIKPDYRNKCSDKEITISKLKD